MTQWIMTQQTGQTEAVTHAAVLGVILRLPPGSLICRSRVLDTATIKDHNVGVVAMESTGVYLKPIFGHSRR
jgi:hypothetical protein